MKPNDKLKKKIIYMYVGTHRHQELSCASQQWWQTDHFWTWAHYLFMQQCMMGAMN